MAAYLRSLGDLQHEDLEWLAPGHGFLVAQPQAALQGLIAHRLRREAKVLAAVQSLGPARLIDLVPRVYDDAPAVLHAVAARSLLAHLLKLQGDQRVTEDGDRWAVSP
jgi:glyoxylase-like metal-dependent hydrolase (beta-lactamase superfamily II)